MVTRLLENSNFSPSQIYIITSIKGYIGKADCLRFMNELEEALVLYSQAISKDDSIKKVSQLKRAITLIEVNKF